MKGFFSGAGKHEGSPSKIVTAQCPQGSYNQFVEPQSKILYGTASGPKKQTSFVQLGVYGAWFLYTYFKDPFPFLSNPARPSKPAGGHSTSVQEEKPHMRYPSWFLFHGMSQAHKATAKSFGTIAGHGLHSSEREVTAIDATHRIYGCQSKCREDQRISSSSVSGSKDSIRSGRQCSIYTGTCILQIGDGQEDFRETNLFQV